MAHQAGQAALAVRRFCFAHSGFAVVVGGPGARTGSTESWTSIQLSSEETFMQADRGACMMAAVVNAVGILQGASAAEEAKGKLMKINPHYRRVASCAHDT